MDGQVWLTRPAGLPLISNSWQARQWEESGEYGRAVDSYLKVDRTVTNNSSTLAQAWGKAAELAVKFLDGDRAVEVADIAGPRLIEVGRHAQAAQLYMGVEMIRYVIINWLFDYDEPFATIATDLMAMTYE